MLPLTGYADRFSVAPGQTIAFKVSSTAATPYQVAPGPPDLGRSQPRGPRHQGGARPRAVRGELPLACPAGAARLLPPRAGRPGVPAARQLHGRRDHLADHARTRAARASWRATIRRPAPGSPSSWTSGARAPWSGTATGGVATVHVGKPLLARTWYRVWATYDAAHAHADRRPDAARASRAGGRRRPRGRLRRLLARARQRHARCSSPRWAARPWAATTTARSSARRSTTSRWGRRRIRGRAGRDRSPPPGGGVGLQPRDLRHPRGRRGAERAPRGAGQPPGPRHDGLDLDGRGDVLAPRARRSTAPSTSTTTTSTTAGGPPTSPTPCRTGSGAASTRCGSGRATSRT